MEQSDKTAVHKDDMNPLGVSSRPDGLVEWRDAYPPDLASGDSRRTTGRLRSCGYCGSMHPADLAASIKAGAALHWADRKYGWPHKAYVERIPNPHAGMLESRMGSSHAVPVCPKTGQPCESGKQSFSWPTCSCMKEAPETVKQGMHDSTPMVSMQDGFSRTTGKPAGVTTDGKFYTVHLQDATPDDRAVIERAMGLHFEFGERGDVRWKPVAAAPQTV